MRVKSVALLEHTLNLICFDLCCEDGMESNSKEVRLKGHIWKPEKLDILLSWLLGQPVSYGDD